MSWNHKSWIPSSTYSVLILYLIQRLPSSYISQRSCGRVNTDLSVIASYILFIYPSNERKHLPSLVANALIMFPKWSGNHVFFCSVAYCSSFLYSFVGVSSQNQRPNGLKPNLAKNMQKCNHFMNFKHGCHFKMTMLSRRK